MTRLPKPYNGVDELVGRLESRGMLLDRASARQWLGAVGYYRLSGYWYPYREFVAGERADTFVAGTRFDEVVALYEFDRKLRTLLHDAIERIEIMLRTQLNEALGQFGPLAYLETQHFRQTFRHEAWVRTAQKRVDRSGRRNDAAQHHLRHYDGQLPIWVLSEVLDFGDVSRLYEGLQSSLQWEIAQHFGINVDLTVLSKNQAAKARRIHPLVRWFEQLTIVRNTAAHHSRTWNGRFVPAGTASLATIPGLETLPEGQSERLYGALCVLGKMLDAASPGTTWGCKVRGLLDVAFIGVTGRQVAEMGFPSDWARRGPWSAQGRT